MEANVDQLLLSLALSESNAVPSSSSSSKENAEANTGSLSSSSEANDAPLSLLSSESNAKINAEVNAEPSSAVAAKVTAVMYCRLFCCRLASVGVASATAVSTLLSMLEAGIWYQHAFEKVQLFLNVCHYLIPQPQDSHMQLLC